MIKAGERQQTDSTPIRGGLAAVPSMRILGHIHTFNDEEIIDRSLEALLNQTYPVEEIVLVDNSSTDGTLARPFPKQVTVIRHAKNLGTSGAVITGMQYALDNGYGWIYIFDADSVPHPNALQKLIELYLSFPPDRQAQIWRLSSLPLEAPQGNPRHGVSFTPKGCAMVQPRPDQAWYECESTIWSGSLYKLSAVRTVGLPNPDYVLDWGEYEYGYCGKLCGYRAVMHQESLMNHSVGDGELPKRRYRVGSFSVEIPQVRVPPIRLYYIFRNMLYFWLYVYHKGNLFRYLQQPSGSPNFLHLVKYVVRVLLLSKHRRADLQACLRGTWDGLCKNLSNRY
jgi:rhamnosyltransferase